MYKVAVAELQPGAYLGKAVVSPDGVVLLRAGMPLRPTYIEHLKRLVIPAVYVANPLAPDVEPPDVVSQKTRTQLGMGLRQITLQALERLRDRGRKDERRWNLDTIAIGAGLDSMVEEALGHPHALVHCTDIRSADDYTLGHSVNVCILSTFLGVTQGLTRPKLRELALGALLHDIGKVTVAPEILQKEGRLSELEMQEVRQHTTRGFELLRRSPQVGLLAAHVAFQHHERWGGGGYPRGLRGGEILEYARIVAVADVYDALVSDRVYRRGLTAWRALNIMLEGSPGFFEPSVVRDFAGHIAVYPVGAIVRLTDGYTGVVVAVRRGEVERPVVRVIRAPDGSLLSAPVTVDLAAAGSLRVDSLLLKEHTSPQAGVEDVADISV